MIGKPNMGTMSMSSFRERFNTALNGRKAAWLSRETGIAGSTLAGYRNGSMPSADAAFRVADALDVDARWLITGHGSPHPGADQPIRSAAEVLRRLEQIESRLHDLTDKEDGEMPPEFSGLREELTALATDEAVSPSRRSHANSLLRIIFDDKDAEARQKTRVSQVRAAIKRAEVLVDEALDLYSSGPARSEREMLRSLAMDESVDRETLRVIISALDRVALSAEWRASSKG